MNRRQMVHTVMVGVGGWALQPLAARAGRAAPGLQSLPPMQTARAAHTLTAIGRDGVLVVGGFADAGAGVAGAEWFDVPNSRWRPLAGALARQSHSATPLGDGRVAIAGGYDEDGVPTAVVEAFEPSSRRFVRAGVLLTPRAGHEVLRLPDDRLLVVGGIAANWHYLDRVEWFDPRGGATAASSMSVAREGHAAVTLDDGRVLVCGGHRGRGAAIEIFASTELFDPRDGRWRPGPPMTTRRHKHDILRLPDGRVLVLGGADARDDRGAYDTTEIFEPATGTFRPGPRLSQPRYKLRGTSHVLADGRVLVTGGADCAEIVDLDSGRGVAIDGPPLAGLFSASVPLGDGRTLVTGGYGIGRSPQPAACLVRTA